MSGSGGQHAREAEAALARARELLSRGGALDEKTRAEVLAALGELSKAIQPALATHPHEARSVGQFTEVVAHEATREQPSTSLLQIGLDGLNEAAERMEQRHPTLVGLAQRIADALAQIGI